MAKKPAARDASRETIDAMARMLRALRDDDLINLMANVRLQNKMLRAEWKRRAQQKLGEKVIRRSPMIRGLLKHALVLGVIVSSMSGCRTERVPPNDSSGFSVSRDAAVDGAP